MAAAFHLPVTAAQVGAYFVGQYYHVLQQQPDFVHQFYTDASTMFRVDGSSRETATSMLQIHTLIMSLNFTGIELKTVQSLESWSGGVLVMVTGSVQMDTGNRRKFVQTFFLAPQEKGYFVLNDIFHFIDEDSIPQHPEALMAQNNFDSELNSSTAIPELVPKYMVAEEIQAKEFVSPNDVEENGQVDKYSFPVPEQQLHQMPETEDILEDNSAEEANGSLQNTMNNAHEPLPAPVEEPVGEPQKHTYASILRVAKGQSAPLVAPPHSLNKNALPASEWHQIQEPNTQQHPTCQQPTVSSVAHEGSGAEATEEVLTTEDVGEIKSVYVRNLPSSVSASEIEEEFKKFGKLKPDGVVIRNRKDVGVYYAFVEFEHITAVQNAIKASTVQIAGRQVFIEERRANSNIPSRGGRRGRGRGSYQSEASRSRYGSRSFGRVNIQDGGDRDYNGPRGNGFYRQSSRHGGFSGNQASRNGHSPSDSSS
ncbi:nuclear transport factor 2-like isoform X2 [Malania oleifera]|uniref:nuclear transport factor 2-like isoform X2 n=1 Tax=Malania oleifera TaxID=397392 RepID=UPI0025AE7BB0|nr:nuclear transport factor 2-like isoform X2 [Malania oleifera]XP_057957278.1 nuclear transport factor 2-like isoform X2 [Malania oleifera]